LLLSDDHLVGRAEQIIAEKCVNAEWALERALGALREVFEQAESPYLRERADDIAMVTRQLLRALMRRELPLTDIPAEGIVVARELSPADVAQLLGCGVRALATERGGVNSHTSIIARSLGIPVVVGLRGVTEALSEGATLIVDGSRGEVMIEPDEPSLRRTELQQRWQSDNAKRMRGERGAPPITRDGERIQLLANIEVPAELPLVLEQGVDGIGLYRTELLFVGRSQWPTEEEHRRDAVDLLQRCGDLPVTIRTWDMATDTESPLAELPDERNPALGLRSIRLCLKRPELFRPQLRGLLRASAVRPFRLLLPKVSSVDELRQARALLDACRAALAAEGAPTGELAIGAMVEMPAAALTAGALAREVDFLSIGTNDLIQYTLGVDRLNDQVAHLYRPLHPAVLRLIAQVVADSAAEGVSVAVCGEMASDPLSALVLLGLGVRELSVNAAALPLVRHAIRACRIDEVSQVSGELLRHATADEAEATLLSEARRLLSGDNWQLVERAAEEHADG